MIRIVWTMKQVLINFKVREEVYDEYEDILQEFLNYLSDLRIEDIDVLEFE